jgi:hypothetical protein
VRLTAGLDGYVESRLHWGLNPGPSNRYGLRDPGRHNGNTNDIHVQDQTEYRASGTELARKSTYWPTRMTANTVSSRKTQTAVEFSVVCNNFISH